MNHILIQIQINIIINVREKNILEEQEKNIKCPCNSFIFITTQQFNQHIKRCIYKKWLVSYDKETKEMRIQEKELRLENSKLKNSKTLDVHIQRIRERIEVNPKSPKRLVTIRGVGYKLND